MQEYVQKSTRTTFVSSSAAVSGCELSEVVAPTRAGNSPLSPVRVLAEAIMPNPTAPIVEAAVPRKRRRLGLISSTIDASRSKTFHSPRDQMLNRTCFTRGMYGPTNFFPESKQESLYSRSSPAPCEQLASFGEGHIRLRHA